MNDGTKKLLPQAVLVGTVLVAMGVFLYARTSAPTGKTMKHEIASVDFTPSTSRGTGSYPDGVYITTGTYAPHGLETELQVKVTLQDDTIVDVDSRLNSEDSFSRQMTDKFKSGYKALVVGKSIKGLELGVVSGSSLTPIGFNEALRKVEAYAETL